MEEKKDKYNDWIKKIHDASGIKSEEKKEKNIEKEKITSDKNNKRSKKVFILPLIIFFLALFPRLFFLFTNDPQSAGLGWYGDVYHHWQVAYLSKEVGFTQGFLRLWDFKGMEYYWGLMHPLMLSTLFSITGSVDILIPRLLSVFGGSLIAVFVYLLVKRYFNLLSAVFAGIWVAFFPVVLFSDTLGMQEQLGLVLLFAGILLWPRFAIITGILWAFASMVRSEYWIFAFALTIASMFDKREKGDKKIVLIISYFIPVALYMKYMLDYTGNPIFPIWWNYLASVVGEWFTNVDEPLDLVQIQAQWIGRAIFLFGATGFIISFIKRPGYYLFFLLGFANVAFIGFIFGFAAYVHGFFDRFWVDRLLAFPYLFSGTLVAIFLMYLLPKLAKNHKFLQVTGVFLFLIMLVLTQFSWLHIFKYFKIAQGSYPAEVELAAVIAKYDMDGKILFPSDRPALTYALVRNHNISGKKLISQMYDPFFYASPGDDPDEIDKKVFEWFEKEDIRVLVIGKAEYKDFTGRYSDQFNEMETAHGATIYEFLR